MANKVNRQRTFNGFLYYSGKTIIFESKEGGRVFINNEGMTNEITDLLHSAGFGSAQRRQAPVKVTIKTDFAG